MKYLNNKFYLRITALVCIGFVTIFVNKTVNIFLKIQADDFSSFQRNISENELLTDYRKVYTINHIEDDTTAQQASNEFKSCKSQYKSRHLNVFLIKSYKAASSTLSNILYRYGMQRALTFVQPNKFYLNQLYPYSFNEASQVPIIPSCTGEYNLCTIHSRFPWKANLSPLMPNNTLVLASVRNPVTQLRSSFNYLRFGSYLRKEGISLEQFIRKPLFYSRQYLNFPKTFNKTNQPHNLVFWNQQSQVFGLSDYNIPPGYGRKEILADEKVMQEVLRFLRRVEEEVDFMVIAENFTESIVMLKYAWNLKWSDVIHIKTNKAVNSHNLPMMNSSEISAIIEWNYIDYLLHKRAKAYFSKLRNNLTYNLEAEITKLHTMTGTVLDYCMTTNVYTTIKGQFINLEQAELSVKGKSNMCCSMLVEQEWLFNRRLKKYMELKKPCKIKQNI